MTMLPQPTPNAEAPSPSEAALRSRRWRRGIWIVGLVAVIGCFGLLGWPQRSRGCKGSPQTEAVYNARQISQALFEFEAAYGSFPAATTIASVHKGTGPVLHLGTTTSNDFFRQLMSSGLATSESMFYARISGTHRPDSVFTGTSALEKGECGFTYFLGATTTSNPRRPVVVAPMIPGTDRFDPKPFDGKAVILKVDQSVNSLKIDKDGHAILDDRNLMDPHHPIWEGNPPSIAWPEL